MNYKRWMSLAVLAIGLSGCGGGSYEPPAPSPQFPMTVTKVGQGSVTSVPLGLNCGTQCATQFESVAQVTLTAAPATNYTFTGWSGACAGTDVCTVTMDQARAITATFTVNAPPPSSYNVSINVVGSGSVGTPGSSNACTGSCSQALPTGLTVPLVATPASGYTFTGWSGNACSGTNTSCTITVNKALTVTATFAPVVVTPPADTIPPTVTSTDPVDGSVDVAINKVVSVGFSETLNCTTATLATVSGLPSTVGCSGQIVTLTPNPAMSNNTTYSVTISGVKDTAGNLMVNKTFSFKTVAAVVTPPVDPNPPTSTNKFSFLAYGDSRSGNGCDGNIVHMDLVSRMAAETGTSFVFNLGDMITGYDKSTSWVSRGDCPSDASRGSFKEIIAPLTAKTAPAGVPQFYIPVIGNHDDNWGDGWYPDKFGQGWCSVFSPQTLGIPNHTRQTAYFKDSRFAISDTDFYTKACSTTSRDVYSSFMYFSFNYQNSHFVVMRLNSDYHDLMECGTCDNNLNDYDHYYYKHQLDWLRYDLAQAQANSSIKNIFVLTHAPLISDSDGHAPNASWPLLLKEFSKAKAKLVMSGHNHVYERSYPVYATDANPQGSRDDTNGTVYVVSGGGGSALAGFRTKSAISAKQTAAYHYMRVDVDGESVNVKVIGRTGNVIDTFSTSGSSTSTPPTDPPVDPNPPTAQGKTYYVSTTGSDSANGTTLTTPFKTLTKAVGVAVGGDIIEVRAGTYNEAVVIRTAGTSDKRIIMRGYAGDSAKPVIRRTGAGPTVYFYNSACDESTIGSGTGNTSCFKSYWTLSGLEIQGSSSGGGDGNVVKIDTANVRLENNKLCCSVADVVKLVRTANDVEVVNNEIFQNSSVTTPGTNAQGVDIVGSDRPLVSGNYVHDVPDFGIYAKGNARNAVFEGNLLVNIGRSDNGHALMLGQETDEERLVDGQYETYDSVVRNNVVVNSTWACVAVSSSYNAKVHNNSCYNTATSGQGSIFLSNESIVGKKGLGVEIYNNIIFGSANKPVIKVNADALSDWTTLKVDGNIYWVSTGSPTFQPNANNGAVSYANWLTQYKTLTTNTDTSRVVNPGYAVTSGTTNLLTLSSGSPAINTGKTLSEVVKDIKGVARPQGGAYDVGAYEQ